MSRHRWRSSPLSGAPRQPDRASPQRKPLGSRPSVCHTCESVKQQQLVLLKIQLLPWSCWSCSTASTRAGQAVLCEYGFALVNQFQSCPVHTQRARGKLEAHLSAYAVKHLAASLDSVFLYFIHCAPSVLQSVFILS